jgi:hypothetical protein
MFGADTRLPTAAAAAAVILVAGYMFAVLGHYRILFDRRFVLWGEKRTGPRNNPEPAERYFTVLAVLAALLVFALRIYK